MRRQSSSVTGGRSVPQILLDRGNGVAGVALNSAPTEGVPVVPFSQLKSTFPVLKNPANRHRAVGFTHEQWQYAFTNTFSEEESRRLYERYAIPASGAICSTACSQRKARPSGDLGRLQERRSRSAAVRLGQRGPHHAAQGQASNAKHYKSDTITEVRLYEGLCASASAQEGWGDRGLRPRLGARARGDSRAP